MGKTMSVKHAAHEREDVPGPGTYESYVEQVKRGNPKYRIGTARRRELNENELNVPGPGAYVALPNDKRRPPSYKYIANSPTIGSDPKRVATSRTSRYLALAPTRLSVMSLWARNTLSG
jgi:hypothetical protein